MLLSVYPDGRVAVTTPYLLNARSAERLIREKAQWLLSKLDYFSTHRQKEMTPRFSRREYLRYRERARTRITQRIETLNRYYGFSYNRISIRDQKTCWGSCSKQRNLNFNYRLLFLPSRICDYVIIHELCHLKELNHSKRFWNLVAHSMPDYQEAKRELQTYSVYLT
jgi:hypothetical protein